MAWISARRGGGGWRMLPGWAAVYLLPALADLARMRCGVRLLERPPLGILCGWVGAYTPVPALLAGIAAALLCAWQPPAGPAESRRCSRRTDALRLRRAAHPPPLQGRLYGQLPHGKAPLQGELAAKPPEGVHCRFAAGIPCKVWQHLALHP